MIRGGRHVLLALVVLGASVTTVRAQGTASAPIVALIDVALTGGAVRDLVFPTTAPGVPATIAPNTSAAGMWQMTNLSSANNAARRYVDLTFDALPSQLTQAVTGATLSITWGNAAQACLAANGTQYSCFGVWTPTQGTMHSVQINGAGSPATPGGNGTRRDLNIYLGGTISPTPAQRAGIYSGVITLTMAYGAT